MRLGFYPSLAFDGIRKNKRLYVPYVLTCISMVMLYYIILSLANDVSIYQIRGGIQLCSILYLGSWVVAVFACIFLFYTNSFLIRRRKKEFGLYNMLGMGKNHISRILLWEVLIVAALSIFFGLLAGIALSKLAQLGLVNLVHGQVNYLLTISFNSIKMTCTVFLVIFFLLLINSIRQVQFESAVNLIKGENLGEKAPKANWLLGIAGVVILLVAYYIAITISDVITAIFVFFVAVVMVIVATYLIMISGSVLMCKILQKNKNYYYQPKHFVSISSMAYRMKRNGAGLASVCILATMVLVTISSTSCLYFGGEDALAAQYSREHVLTMSVEHYEDLSKSNTNLLRKEIVKYCEEHDIDMANVLDVVKIHTSGLIEGSYVQLSNHDTDDVPYDKLRVFNFVTTQQYEALTGVHYDLKDDEVVLVTSEKYEHDTIQWEESDVYHVNQIESQVPTVVDDMTYQVFAKMTVVMNDVKSMLNSFEEINPRSVFEYTWLYGFDSQLDDVAQIEFNNQLEHYLIDDIKENPKFNYWSLQSRAEQAEDFYGTFAGLFYIGIILSIVFILGSVLIIYYKQISEGYEDQSRYEIMRKVGMTKKEIQDSINSQLLTVFFLPLLFAGLHLSCAFPLVRLLLQLFGLFNVGLFIITTVITFVVYSIFYIIVYKLTGNAYYKIVSTSAQ